MIPLRWHSGKTDPWDHVVIHVGRRQTKGCQGLGVEGGGLTTKEQRSMGKQGGRESRVLCLHCGGVTQLYMDAKTHRAVH